MPVGGIKEKIIAAHRAGAKRIILPAENEKDLEDVPADVLKDMEFTPVATVEELIKAALDVDIPPAGSLFAVDDNSLGGVGEERKE
jgi:ATP-dependent Lon protease